MYDIEIQQEMDVIITVLNRLFDETNTRFYIGNKQPNDINMENPAYPVHNKTNKTLTIINTNTNKIKRNNRGLFMDPPSSNLPMIVGDTNTMRNAPKNSKRITRKAPRSRFIVNNLNQQNLANSHKRPL